MPKNFALTNPRSKTPVSSAHCRTSVRFDVSVVNMGFGRKFFDWISHAASGSFLGISEGEKTLEKILEQFDFNDEKSAISFLSDIMSYLIEDKRAPVSTPVSISDQLKKGKTTQSLYDYIFSLEYLEPRYVLKLGNKELNQLSPGEKGALLLVFYLLIDKENTPLIIDQPEENLDSQTVYELLVPCIKEAKKHRQVFIVTHNPNLAVVCDAEQIVRASLDKFDKNRVVYTSGAIENPILNKWTIDILEGTRPAFNNRGAKYHLPIE